MRAQVGEGQGREGYRESQAGSALAANVGLPLMNSEIMTKSQTLNRLSHQVPRTLFHPGIKLKGRLHASFIYLNLYLANCLYFWVSLLGLL